MSDTVILINTGVPLRTGFTHAHFGGDKFSGMIFLSGTHRKRYHRYGSLVNCGDDVATERVLWSDDGGLRAKCVLLKVRVILRDILLL